MNSEYDFWTPSMDWAIEKFMEKTTSIYDLDWTQHIDIKHNCFVDSTPIGVGITNL